MDGSPPEAVLAAYAAAVRAKDVSAFIALYDDGTRIFDLWGKWSYEGAAAWREAVAEWFGSLGDETVEVTFDEISRNPGEGLSALSAIVTYAALAPSGERLRSMQNRHSWVLTWQSGSWRIAHEHSSAPVDPETMKVMLQK